MSAKKKQNKIGLQLLAGIALVAIILGIIGTGITFFIALGSQNDTQNGSGLPASLEADAVSAESATTINAQELLDESQVLSESQTSAESQSGSQDQQDQIQNETQESNSQQSESPIE